MGDMKKRTFDKIREREQRKERTVQSENETIDKMSKRPGRKDKAISARINGDTYQKFRKICQMRGLTVNACINMIMTDFVRENKEILQEEI